MIAIRTAPVCCPAQLSQVHQQRGFILLELLTRKSLPLGLLRCSLFRGANLFPLIEVMQARRFPPPDFCVRISPNMPDTSMSPMEQFEMGAGKLRRMLCVWAVVLMCFSGFVLRNYKQTLDRFELANGVTHVGNGIERTEAGQLTLSQVEEAEAAFHSYADRGWELLGNGILFLLIALFLRMAPWASSILIFLVGFATYRLFTFPTEKVVGSVLINFGIFPFIASLGNTVLCVMAIVGIVFLLQIRRQISVTSPL